MINFYYWPTPNARKVSILLEELKLKYKLIKIDINKGDQFEKKFLDISPNNKIPAIQLIEGNHKFNLFESGAILLFFAEKYDPKLIASKIDEFYNTDITKYSYAGKAWGESNSWKYLKSRYIDLINSLC